MNAQSGVVYLVGAGPGAADLITVRGLAVLREADVILHDRLVDRELLSAAPQQAQIIDVGKAPGDKLLTQRDINEDLIRYARQGLRVVRLKGGDPFIYGRGWEELSACREAGVDCVVVPGLSSALAVPALADVALTQRGISRSFVVITAQSAAAAGTPHLNYEALAEIDTIVVLMGRKGLSALAGQLISAGRAGNTPAVSIERGATPEQRTCGGTLASISAEVEHCGLQAPLVTVIGVVAATSPTTGGPPVGAGAQAQHGPPISQPLMEIVNAATRTSSSELDEEL